MINYQYYKPRWLMLVQKGEIAMKGVKKRYLDEDLLVKWTNKYPDGVTLQDILNIFNGYDVRLSAATFRRYVQLGLLERSIRVGRKGQRGGSWGLYPIRVLHQVNEIKRCLAGGYTLDELASSRVPVQRNISAMRTTLEKSKETLIQQHGIDAAKKAIKKIDQIVTAIERLIAEINYLKK